MINKNEQEIINSIAAEFPYCISDVTTVYIDSGYSEVKTREILMMRLIMGV